MNRRYGISIMFKLLHLVGGFVSIIILAVINGSLGFLFSMATIFMGALAVAKYFGENIELTYLTIGLIGLFFGLTRGILRYFEQYSNHYIAFKILAIIRDKLFKKLVKLAPARLENKKKGDLISILTADIETLEVFYAHTISPIAIAFFVGLTVFIFTLVYASYILALVLLLSNIIIGIVIPIISSKLLEKDGIKYRKSLSSFNSYVMDSIYGINDLVLSNNEDERLDIIDQRSIEINDITNKTNSKSVYISGITNLVVSLLIVLILSVSIYLTLTSNLEIGKTILTISLIFSSFGPFFALSGLPPLLTQTFASGNRVLNLLKEKETVLDINDKNDIKSNELVLKIKDLKFKYDDIDVLKNINITLNKNEIISIVGRSGCGKSTLLKLILRFYNKDSGSILINDLDVNEINTKSLYEKITLVSQDTYLFNDTIYNNLIMAKPNATMDEIIDACKKASIYEFINNLDNKFDTLINTLADNISAGQIQRIGLARAFLHNSDIILLDEITSNVDCINEGIILKALKELKKEKSIIIVSHRLSTIKIADRSYDIIDGVSYER